MSAGKRVEDRPLWTGWRPSDRNDLVVWVMVARDELWLAPVDIMHAIAENPKWRSWWDYLPSYRAGVAQTIYLSAQNVESRLRHLQNHRRVVLRRLHDDGGNYSGPSYSLMTPAALEAQTRELCDRIRIPDDLRDDALVSSSSVGIEVETRVGPSDDHEYPAQAVVLVRTKRGEAKFATDVSVGITDARIRVVWSELLIEAGLRTRVKE